MKNGHRSKTQFAVNRVLYIYLKKNIYIYIIYIIGWIDGEMDGWMDVRIRGMDGCMGGWMDGWMGGWMDGWIDGWVDGWMDGLAVAACWPLAGCGWDVWIDGMDGWVA